MNQAESSTYLIISLLHRTKTIVSRLWRRLVQPGRRPRLTYWSKEYQDDTYVLRYDGMYTNGGCRFQQFCRLMSPVWGNALLSLLFFMINYTEYLCYSWKKTINSLSSTRPFDGLDNVHTASGGRDRRHSPNKLLIWSNEIDAIVHEVFILRTASGSGLGPVPCLNQMLNFKFTVRRFSS